MTQRIVLSPKPSQQTSVLVVSPSPSTSAAVAPSSTNQPNGIEQQQIAQTWPLKCVVAASQVVTIPAPVYFGTPSPLQMLATFLAIGRTYHPLCRNAFVEKVQHGNYAYERCDEWRTCAVAAAYAGAFGSQSVERPEFSYSMAVWRLNQRVGYNLDQLWIVGPTGRKSTIYDEMILLTDTNLWATDGLVEWLPTAAIVQQGRLNQ